MAAKKFDVVVHVSFVITADSRSQAEEIGYGWEMEHPQTGETVYPDYVDVDATEIDGVDDDGR